MRIVLSMLRRMRIPRPLPVSVLLAVAALAAGAAGCGASDEDRSGPGREATLSLVATTTQVADFAREVGGDRVEVHQILQANSDPHGYEPRPSDAEALADADLVLRSGGDLDEWLADLIDNAGGDAPTVELIEAARTIEGDDHGTDAHWWQNPRNAIAAVEAIEAALIETDPAGRAEYRADADAYVERLRALDRNVAACIEDIPPAQRKLVTTHDALGYYADRYGIEVVGALIPSLSTAAQPSAGDIRELVDQIREQDVEAIFPESSIDPKLERAVARETGATVGRPLWADTLGPAGSDGSTYIQSIQSNTAALVDGLTASTTHCRPDA